MIVIIGGAAGSKIATEIFQLNGCEEINYVETYWSSKQSVQLFSSYKDAVDLIKNDNVEYFVGTGDNEMRKSITSYIIENTQKYPINCIHPKAIISPSAKIGHGNLICPGAVVYTDAIIEDSTIINTNCVIEHDCHVKNYAQISPGSTICGYVEVGELAFVGAGASVIPNIKIGKSSIVAAGATVIDDVKPKTLVAGVPAKIKKI